MYSLPDVLMCLYYNVILVTEDLHLETVKCTLANAAISCLTNKVLYYFSEASPMQEKLIARQHYIYIIMFAGAFPPFDIYQC